MTVGHVAGTAASVEAFPVGRVDWRVERLLSLMGADWLAGEWDPERHLVLPRSGGSLARVSRCVVVDCPGDGRGIKVLCGRHRVQFAASTITDLGTWLTGGEPGVFPGRLGFDQGCAVIGADSRGCPRPAMGHWRLCSMHTRAWDRTRVKGTTFDEFVVRAVGLADFGPCVATCCYLRATNRDQALCGTHKQLWRKAGHPEGREFAAWAAAVRQPVNGAVLSLRGLPTVVRLELLFAIGCRASEQVSLVTDGIRPWVDQLRAGGVSSVSDLNVADLDGIGSAHLVRFARFCVDRVGLAYADVDDERRRDVWDLRLFGRPGRRRLNFTGIRQRWLREATKDWAAVTVGRIGDNGLSHRVGSVAILSSVLAAGPAGGEDPAALSRADVERFLTRLRSPGFPPGGRPFGTRARADALQECALVIREIRELGLVPALGATFAFRRGDRSPRQTSPPPGRALPPRVVAQLDAQLDLLAAVPGAPDADRVATLGALGERAGPIAVLAYQLLKGTGRRVGEVATLHVDCLDVDEHGKDVLIYDNHKAGRLRRRLPLADSELVAAIRDQQAWVTGRFPDTAAQRLWLLPRPYKNIDGTNHLSTDQIQNWIGTWVERIPLITAGSIDPTGEPVPFAKKAIHPHAFRHTYAQTLADQGVAPSVLRDLMDHRSLSTTLAYYQVGDTRKRAAMEMLARHTIDNRGVTRPTEGDASRAGTLREQLSWVAVPMGKCSEPSNVRASGQACPIRYQCAGCPHFESDPSYLPELRGYVDDLRREREAMLAADTADWAVQNTTRQIEVIDDHIHTHQQLLQNLPADQRAVIEEASDTVRKARRSVPVAFGRRRGDDGRG